MITELAHTLLKNELAELKGRTAGAGLMLLAACCLGAATLFAMLALYLWLATHVSAWQAASLIVVVLSAAGAILWLAGQRRMRQERRRQEALASTLDELLRAGRESTAQGDGNVDLVAVAGLVGLLVGRRLSR